MKTTKTRVKKPNKLKCIRDYCLGCAGDSPTEVTLCHIADCPLWEYRTGNHISSPVYMKRLRSAAERNPEIVRELLDGGGNNPVFARICDDMKHTGAKID